MPPPSMPGSKGKVVNLNCADMMGYLSLRGQPSFFNAAWGLFTLRIKDHIFPPSLSMKFHEVFTQSLRAMSFGGKSHGCF